MKKALKISLDIALIVLLICLMPYLHIGERAHEWLGALFVILVWVHVKLNWAAFQAGFRRFWSSPLRLLNCLITSLASLAFLALLISGPFISKYVFVFLPISGGAALARSIHLLAAYWAFIFFSLHLGLFLERAFGLTKYAASSPRASKTLFIIALMATNLA
ncbi:MAG: DUF4405 domain-containing protein, partial [Deltaproteobacteria bacterium]|nr:DUF4405 domain-containing protein [Deltaproteobacteria bacterium]